MTIEPESQHERDLRAERTLLGVTLGMREDELTNFLDSYSITREEYEYILSKHVRVVERWKEENLKEEK